MKKLNESYAKLLPNSIPATLICQERYDHDRAQVYNRLNHTTISDILWCSTHGLWVMELKKIQNQNNPNAIVVYANNSSPYSAFTDLVTLEVDKRYLWRAEDLIEYWNEIFNITGIVSDAVDILKHWSLQEDKIMNFVMKYYTRYYNELKALQDRKLKPKFDLIPFIVNKDEDSCYGATSPAVPGFSSAGDDLAQLICNIREGLKAHTELSEKNDGAPFVFKDDWKRTGTLTVGGDLLIFIEV